MILRAKKRLRGKPRKANTPAQAQKCVIVRRDGREVCAKTFRGRKEYHRRVVAMCERQSWCCSICGGPMVLGESATFEHTDGRGMGGGHRDDRIEINGKPHNSAAHGFCNAMKGSKREARA